MTVESKWNDGFKIQEHSQNNSEKFTLIGILGRKFDFIWIPVSKISGAAQENSGTQL